MVSQAPLFGLARTGAELGRQQAWVLSNLCFLDISLTQLMGLLFSECVSGALLDTFLKSHSNRLDPNNLRSMDEHKKIS